MDQSSRQSQPEFPSQAAQQAGGGLTPGIAQLLAIRSELLAKTSAIRLLGAC